MLIEVAIGESLQTKAAYLYTVTSIFINSALNPLIYCWRMMEIRMAIRKIINFPNAVTLIETEKSFIVTKKQPSLELQTIQPSLISDNPGLYDSNDSFKFTANELDHDVP